ncbi:MAG: phosphomannomutase/phosphoglucomutase [Alphaproteobacteria bacterium]|nr:phosphomannomutase/phosphoglucomutase [Alphaproteobacteria bacterium]
MDERPEPLIQHQFHPTILRAYDIRGIVGETLHDKDAYMIGLGFAATLRQRGGSSVAIGRDGRLSSPDLSAALARGLVDGGMTVTDIGTGPTPKLYFADITLNCDGAIQVTGSHNPPSHNGFKMVLGHKPFFGEDITALGRLMAEGVAPGVGGSLKEVDLQADYVNSLISAAGDLADLAGMTVVWDCGNGAAGPSTLEVTSRLAGNHHVMFPEIDGTFPNHHPDPVDPATLDQLRAAVTQHHAVMGIGFDGDGDRIGVIDAKGRQVPGDLLTAYLARHSVRENAAADVIFDVKSSLTALDVVAGLGGTPSLWKTGHSHMKMKLKETGAPIAGEMSGHIFIADRYFGFDDAIFAALAVLREMVVSGETITAFIDSLPDVYATPELRIACDDERKFGIVEKVIADVTAAPDPDTSDIADMDGIRVTGALGWWLIRASNTGAELVARAEGRDEAARDTLKTRIRARLADAGLDWTG